MPARHPLNAEATMKLLGLSAIAASRGFVVWHVLTATEVLAPFFFGPP
jgi:hypothetical protein